MFQSRYQLRISGKDTKRFLHYLIKRGCYFEKITFQDEDIILLVDEQNWKKITSQKTVYEIKLQNVYGMVSFFQWIKRNSYLIFSFFLGIVLLLFLSNIIFEVEVVHSDEELRSFLLRELKQYEIHPFRFVVNYQKKEKIRNAILENNKSRLEWMELERRGVKYYIRVEERIIKKEKEKKKPQNIVAKKDGIILKIEASSGEIVKAVNTYVRKGDVIISGEIKKDDKVVDTVGAEGKVFAEVWYQVNITLPKHYYEEKKTNQSHYALNFTLFGTKYQLFPFHKYHDYQEKNQILMGDTLNFFSISINYQEEVNIIDKKYTKSNCEKILNQIAREKVLNYIGSEGEILSQKNLKIIEKNSTIVSTVFFKVKEDITAIGEIQKTEDLKENER